MDSLVQVGQEGRVTTLTITRPQQLNALNTDVLGELYRHVVAAQKDPSVGCVVIRGEGDRAFSAGADLDEIRGLSIEQAQEFIRGGHRTMSAIADASVPVIAEVDGFALGGGFELMLACHLVVASERSQFGLPEVLIGCIPGFGGTQRLRASVGKPAAMHLMLTGERIDAQRAWEIGLLSVPPCDPAGISDEVARMSAQVAAGSKTGIANLLAAARPATASAALGHEAALAASAIVSADGLEGITSFAERRQPKFHKETP